jgi:hypothetical protein
MFGARGQDASRSKKTRRPAIKGEKRKLARLNASRMINLSKYVPGSNHRLSNWGQEMKNTDVYT